MITFRGFWGNISWSLAKIFRFVAVVQLVSRVQRFVTLWTAARQASLSITSSRSLLKLMSLSRWCHSTISCSVVPFSSCPQFFTEFKPGHLPVALTLDLISRFLSRCQVCAILVFSDARMALGFHFSGNSSPLCCLSVSFLHSPSFWGCHCLRTLHPHRARAVSSPREKLPLEVQWPSFMYLQNHCVWFSSPETCPPGTGAMTLPIGAGGAQPDGLLGETPGLCIRVWTLTWDWGCGKILWEEPPNHSTHFGGEAPPGLLGQNHSFQAWASVPQHQINSQKQSSGWSRKNSLIALPGRGPQQAECVLTQVVRSFIVKEAQRGGWCYPLTYLPLTGGWWGRRESASSTFWFQQVWAPRACGRPTVNFSRLVGLSVSAKQLKDPVLCIPWGGSGPAPRLRCCFSRCSSLVSGPSLPWLASVWTSRWDSGRSWRLNEAHFLNEKMGALREASVPPQGPAGFQPVAQVESPSKETAPITTGQLRTGEEAEGIHFFGQTRGESQR